MANPIVIRQPRTWSSTTKFTVLASSRRVTMAICTSPREEPTQLFGCHLRSDDRQQERRVADACALDHARNPVRRVRLVGTKAHPRRINAGQKPSVENSHAATKLVGNSASEQRANDATDVVGHVVPEREIDPAVRQRGRLGDALFVRVHNQHAASHALIVAEEGATEGCEDAHDDRVHLAIDINPMLSYDGLISKDVVGDGVMSVLIFSIVDFVSTIPAMRRVDTFGRRQLLLVGAVGMVLGRVLSGITFTAGCDGNTDDSGRSKTAEYIIIVDTALFISNFAISWGPVCWIYPAEIFPMNVRAPRERVRHVRVAVDHVQLGHGHVHGVGRQALPVAQHQWRLLLVLRHVLLLEDIESLFVKDGGKQKFEWDKQLWNRWNLSAREPRNRTERIAQRLQPRFRVPTIGPLVLVHDQSERFGLVAFVPQLSHHRYPILAQHGERGSLRLQCIFVLISPRSYRFGILFGHLDRLKERIEVEMELQTLFFDCAAARDSECGMSASGSAQKRVKLREDIGECSNCLIAQRCSRTLQIYDRCNRADAPSNLFAHWLGFHHVFIEGRCLVQKDLKVVAHDGGLRRHARDCMSGVEEQELRAGALCLSLLYASFSIFEHSSLLWMGTDTVYCPGDSRWALIFLNERSNQRELKACGYAYMGPEATNNWCEYSALKDGLAYSAHYLQRYEVKLEVFGDNQMIIAPQNGFSSIRQTKLQPLAVRVNQVIANFARTSWNRTKREQNKMADLLANMAMNSKSAKILTDESRGNDQVVMSQVAALLDNDIGATPSKLRNTSLRTMGNVASSAPPAFVYAANDFQLVIETSKEFEFLLETEFQAEGKGLHEKISSASPPLPPPTVKSLRYIASVRNALVHDRSVKALPDRAAFIRRSKSAMEEIQIIIDKRRMDAEAAARDPVRPTDACFLM
ncbi:Major facilitator superfamily, partial [Globisporangium splendens]